MNKFLMVSACFLLASCSKDKAINANVVAVCDSSSISYTRNIQQILNNNCAQSGCHDASSAESGFVFTDYNNSKSVNQALDNINNRNGALLMPTTGKMPDSLITQIEQWVANGYCQ